MLLYPESIPHSNHMPSGHSSNTVPCDIWMLAKWVFIVVVTMTFQWRSFCISFGGLPLGTQICQILVKASYKQTIMHFCSEQVCFIGFNVILRMSMIKRRNQKLVMFHVLFVVGNLEIDCWNVFLFFYWLKMETMLSGVTPTLTKGNNGSLTCVQA